MYHFDVRILYIRLFDDNPYLLLWFRMGRDLYHISIRMAKGILLMWILSILTFFKTLSLQDGFVKGKLLEPLRKAVFYHSTNFFYHLTNFKRSSFGQFWQLNYFLKSRIEITWEWDRDKTGDLKIVIVHCLVLSLYWNIVSKWRRNWGTCEWISLPTYSCCLLCQPQPGEAGEYDLLNLPSRQRSKLSVMTHLYRTTQFSHHSRNTINVQGCCLQRLYTLCGLWRGQQRNLSLKTTKTTTKLPCEQFLFCNDIYTENVIWF